MLVSFIITVYNRRSLIEKCLNSILESKVYDYEIIIVDDCSSDGSYEYCKELSLKYNDIRIIRHDKNMGVGVSKNDGIQNAKGHFVYVIDSDDFVITEKLPKIFNILQENKEIDILAANCIVNNLGVETEMVFFEEEGLFNIEDVIKNNFFIYLKYGMCLNFYNRDFIRKYYIEVPNINYQEDAVFNISFFIYTRKVYILKDCIYYYNHTTEDSLSSNATYEDRLKYASRYFETINKCLKGEEISQIKLDVINKLASMCCLHMIFLNNNIKKIIQQNLNDYNNKELIEVYSDRGLEECTKLVWNKVFYKIKRFQEKDSNNIYFVPAGRSSRDLAKQYCICGGSIDGFFDNYGFGKKVILDRIGEFDIYSFNKIRNDMKIVIFSETNVGYELYKQIKDLGVSEKNIYFVTEDI